TLLESGAGVLRMEPSTSFHKAHRAPQDARWSHAKLYHFKRGRAERLLLTSANFSRAAWGAPTTAGGLRIENFELGVCLEKVVWPVDDAEPFEKTSDVFTTLGETSEVARLIGWADASWDGREVTLRCRVQTALPLSVSIVSADSELVTSNSTWKPDGERNVICRTPWLDVARPPALARFVVGDEQVEVGVRDMRPVAELSLSPLPDMTASESDELRDRLLLEEYGHYYSGGDDDASAETVLAVDESIPPPDGAALPSANYAVPVFEMARERFQIVDRWAQTARTAIEKSDGQYLRSRLHADGERLVLILSKACERAATDTLALPNRLAAEELAWRVDDLRERLEANDE
ncbi:MAG: hypothetical protein JWN04_1501, partial [Myxococcaceae bacterium]|nr:hypothetical protein [Myxococcaceae bacterium]